MNAWLATIKNVQHHLVDAVFPPLCTGCKADVVTQGALCAACWGALNFISGAQCMVCGVPFDIIDSASLGAGGMACEACVNEPPRFSRARAPLVYDETSRSMIMALKHGDRHYLVPTMVPLLRTAGAELLARADMLVPVPLSRWRLWRRRYNQSAMLCTALAETTGITAGVDVLQRVRNTPSQGRMSRKERQKNVRGAFALNPAYAERIRRQTVVLVDDVLTSGATANECTKVLMEAGASRVDVLTFARTPLGR